MKNKQEIKLIAFDLDGTFLDSRKNIPQKNLDAIKAAAEKGIYIVPATGRLAGGIPEELRKLEFIRYYILINGAEIYDAREDRVLHRADLSNELALRIFRHAEEMDCLYDCYLRGKGMMSADMLKRLPDYVIDKNFVNFMISIRTPVDDLQQLIASDGDNVQKVQYFFRDMSLRERELAQLEKIFPEVSATSSLGSNIEINSAEAGKGKALVWLCRYLGFDACNALAFGDGTNDAEMLSLAGTGAAMANCDEKLLEYSDIVVKSNDEAGVGKAVFDMVL